MEKKDFNFEGWAWHDMSGRDILEPWFSERDRFIKENTVKANDQRIVFTVPWKADTLYIKYDRPSGFYPKIKARFRSKVRSEFESAKLLEKNGIGVVEFLGWGEKGTDGMLISREFPGALSSRDFWFDKAALDSALKEQFLNSFSIFLKKFFSANLFHPDFHLGNILFVPEKFDFILVDPYGLSKQNKIPEEKLFEMARIIGSFRGELSEEETHKFLIDSGLSNSDSQAGSLWKKILNAEALEVDKLWEKRQKQILSGKSKYSLELALPESGKTQLRKNMSGVTLLGNEELPESQDGLEKIELKQEDAEKYWLASFKLQFHRIEHRKPLIWIKNNQSGKSELLLEKHEICENDNDKIKEDFIKRASFSNLDLNKDQLEIDKNNQGFIKDIEPLINKIVN